MHLKIKSINTGSRQISSVCVSVCQNLKLRSTRDATSTPHVLHRFPLTAFVFLWIPHYQYFTESFYFILIVKQLNRFSMSLVFKHNARNAQMWERSVREGWQPALLSSVLCGAQDQSSPSRELETSILEAIQMDINVIKIELWTTIDTTLLSVTKRQPLISERSKGQIVHMKALWRGCRLLPLTYAIHPWHFLHPWDRQHSFF